MRRLVQSDIYARAKLVSAALFIFLGAATIVHTVTSVGIIAKATPAYVLGAAMIALGVVRFRDYRAAKAPR